MRKTLLVLLALCCMLFSALSEGTDGREEAYARAIELMDKTGEANYDDAAYGILWKLRGYKDADARCYRYGMQLIEMGEYQEAHKVFMRLSGYEDADQKAYALYISFLCGLDYLTPSSAVYTFHDLIGAVDFESNTIVPPKWTERQWLTEGFYAVRENGLWGVIDGRGAYLFEPQWDGISLANEGRCVTYHKNAFGLIDLNGSVLQKCVWKQIGSSCVTEEEEANLEMPLFLHGLIPVQNKKGLWGYLGEDGAVAIEPQYLSATDFDSELALAAVLTPDKLYKIIDTNNEEAFFTNQPYFAKLHAERYDEAMQLLQAGKYEEAIEGFGALGFYKDSELQLQVACMALGNEYFAEGSFQEAQAAYERAGDHPGAGEKLNEVRQLLWDAAEDAALDTAQAAAAAVSEPAPTPLPAGVYSLISSDAQKVKWMLDKETRVKNGITKLEILASENGGSVISFTGWSYGNREGFDGLNENICYIYVVNVKGDMLFYETTKAPGATGIQHTLRNGHNMEYSDFTCVLDVSAYPNGTYTLGGCNQFKISGDTFRHGYTFGDAYSFTVVEGIVTSMGGVSNGN